MLVDSHLLQKHIQLLYKTHNSLNTEIILLLTTCNNYLIYSYSKPEASLIYIPYILRTDIILFNYSMKLFKVIIDSFSLLTAVSQHQESLRISLCTHIAG
jgi:hypothetical protein